MTGVEQGRRSGGRGALVAPCYVWPHFYYLLLIVNKLFYPIKIICLSARTASQQHVHPGDHCSKGGAEIAATAAGAAEELAALEATAAVAGLPLDEDTIHPDTNPTVAALRQQATQQGASEERARLPAEPTEQEPAQLTPSPTAQKPATAPTNDAINTDTQQQPSTADDQYRDEGVPASWHWHRTEKSDGYNSDNSVYSWLTHGNSSYRGTVEKLSL